MELNLEDYKKDFPIWIAVINKKNTTYFNAFINFFCSYFKNNDFDSETIKTIINQLNKQADWKTACDLLSNELTHCPKNENDLKKLFCKHEEKLIKNLISSILGADKYLESCSDKLKNEVANDVEARLKAEFKQEYDKELEKSINKMSEDYKYKTDMYEKQVQDANEKYEQEKSIKKEIQINNTMLKESLESKTKEYSDTKNQLETVTKKNLDLEEEKGKREKSHEKKIKESQEAQDKLKKKLKNANSEKKDVKDKLK